MVIQWRTLYRGLHDHETGICSNSIDIIWRKGEKKRELPACIFFKNSGEFFCRIVSQNVRPQIIFIHCIGNFFTVH
jgi:hypothetical protein